MKNSFVRKVTSLVTCVMLTAPLALGVSGCAVGTTAIEKEDSTTLAQKIVRGKTTKAQITAMFGEPMDKGMRDGRQFWAYRMTTASARTFIPFAALATNNSGTEYKELTVFFDKAGVVHSFDLVQSKG